MSADDLQGNATEMQKDGGTTGLDDFDLYCRLKEFFKAAEDHTRAWRAEAREDFDFVAGDQWSKRDKAHLEDQGRVPITFNRTVAIVKAVCGLEINSRHETVYLPRGTNAGEVRANEVLTAASQWMADGCDAEDEQSSAFQDTVICGMGWCLSGDAMVRLPDTHFATVRDYSGLVIEIDLKNGQKLTGTPNHPVLTDRGWKGLGSLNEGDNLITSAILERIEGFPVQQFDQVEARLEDKVNAFGAGRKARRFATAADDFYADGRGSEVHIVYSDSALWRKFDNAVALQKAKQALLVGRDAIARLGVSLFGFGVPLHACRATEGLLPVGVGHAPRADGSRTNNIAHFISGGAQSLADRLAGYSNFLADFVRGQGAVKVEGDQFVNAGSGPSPTMKRAELVPGADKPALNGGVRYAELIANFRDWKPALEVEARNLCRSGVDLSQFVTRVERRVIKSVHNFPVYDVGTSLGMFVAGNIVTSNTEARIDYELEADGMYCEDKIDPLEMFWDKSARKKNLTDARHMFRVRKMTLADAKEMFPDVDEADLDAPWAVGGDETQEPKAIEQRRKKRDPAEGPDQADEVHIVHAQWYEKVPYFRVSNPQNPQAVEEVAEDEFEMLKQAAEAQGVQIKSVRQVKRVYKQAFLGGKILGGVMEGPAGDRFSWGCITGELDRNKGTFYGLVRVMKDPQRMANKWMSQITHILNSTAKGGIIAEAKAFKDQRAAQDTYAQPDAITWAADGAIQKGMIMQKPGSGVAQPYVMLMEFAISSIRDASGVNLELLGMRDANQPGILEAQRKQAGMTILATLFDSLRRFRKQIGRIRLYYIQNYLADGRLIRIAKDDGTTQAIPLLREQSMGQYEVIVEDAPTSPNSKEQTWATIQQVLPAFKELLTPEAVITVLEYSPLPSKLVGAFKEMAAKPNPEADMAKEIAAAVQKVKIERDRAAAAKDDATAEATRVGSIIDLATAGVQAASLGLLGATDNIMSPEPWQGRMLDLTAMPEQPNPMAPPMMPQVPPMPTGMQRPLPMAEDEGPLPPMPMPI